MLAHFRPYVSEYRAKGVLNGRLYALQPTGQNSPKICRLLANGEQHMELDMVGAHIAVFITFCEPLRLKGIHNPAALFDQLCGEHLPREVVKKTVYLLLNSTLAHALDFVQTSYRRAGGWLLPAHVIALCRLIESSKPAVVENIQNVLSASSARRHSLKC